MKAWHVVAGVVGFFALVAMFAYNGMVGGRNNALEKFSTIQVMEQRRGDLIPNHVETTKGYARHESEVFSNVTNARAKVGQLTVNIDPAKLSDPAFMKQLQDAQATLAGALSRLLAVSERYPELKANELFMRTQDELAGSENRIAVARRNYNLAVRDYNTSIEHFPNVLVAGMFGFRRMELFQAAEGSRQVPNVKF